MQGRLCQVRNLSISLASGVSSSSVSMPHQVRTHHPRLRKQQREPTPERETKQGRRMTPVQGEAKQSVSRTTPVVSHGVLLNFLVKVAEAVLVGVQGDSDWHCRFSPSCHHIHTRTSELKHVCLGSIPQQSDVHGRAESVCP